MVEKKFLVKRSSYKIKGFYIILILLFTLHGFDFTSGVSSEGLNNFQGVNLVNLPNVEIDGDAELDQFALDYSNGGTGLPGDPYIFELNITSPFSGIQLLIQNTLKHFTIDNSIIANGDLSGIKFDNVENGQINNSQIYSNGDGIHFLSSENNIIFNNDITDHQGLGIKFQDSHNNIIDSNQINNNGLGYTQITLDNHVGGGILLNPSHDNILRFNVISDNYGSGVQLESSNRNILYDNDLLSNYGWGIKSLSSLETRYELNEVIMNGIATPVEGISPDNHVGGGILLNPSHHNILLNNLITQNVGDGIYAQLVENVTIWGNTISENDETGLELEGVIEGSVMVNMIQNNDWYGLFIHGDSANILVANNTISGNDLGDIFVEDNGTNSTFNLTPPYTTILPAIDESDDDLTFFWTIFIPVILVISIKRKKYSI